MNGSGLATKVAVHAIVGGLIAEAAGGDFRTAALAAGANEALLETFGSKIFPGDAHERLLAMTSQLVGMTVAAAAGGTAKDQEKAGWVTQQATAYNYLKHEEVDALAKELVGCRASADPLACRGGVQDKYQALNDSKTGAGLYGCKALGEVACNGQYTAAKSGSAQLDSLLDSVALNAEEKGVLAHFQDLNHDDERVADHAWLQSFWSESGVAGGILTSGAAAIAAAERATATTATVSGAKATVEVPANQPVSKPAYPASQADGDFGYLNQPGPSKPAAFFDTQASAKSFINNGRINISDLQRLVPPGTPNSFQPSATIAAGSKFQYKINGQNVEVKWHAPDASAAERFPGSNSGSGWTAQIKIGGKLLGQDGLLYRKPSNLTHIPVDF
ncbi:hypothetical protein DB356_15160 [Pseudomonas congelans]|uniref:hypothetical protein n=1 Tax=Pseudomonas congelans TaxID=200452 RepID=UPI001BDCBFD7|nr:hypothetical protein DB356_15160 [Pseudomonas congelans]